MSFIIEGLSWDWVNKKMYWTDYCQDQIEVYDPATLHRRVLVTTGTNPFAIIADPGTGYGSPWPHPSCCEDFVNSFAVGSIGLTLGQGPLSGYLWTENLAQFFTIPTCKLPMLLLSTMPPKPCTGLTML